MKPVNKLRLLSVGLLVLLALPDPLLAQPAVPSPKTMQQANLHRDIEYGRASGETLLLDAFVPEGAGPFPVAILVHGGGWGSGDKAKDIVTPIAEPLGRAGFAWFSINYRLAPKNRWPAAIEDVQTAIRWVKAHAAEFRGDPNRIVLIGYSAGAHLAALAAVRAERETAVQAVIGFAAPTDLPADTERRGGLSKALQDLLDRPLEVDAAAQEILQNLSPITYVQPGLTPPGLPPFLLIHGTEDKSVPYTQSLNFQKRLREIGVPCDLITIAGAPHSIGQWDKFSASYKVGMVAWLRRTLGSASPDITVAADGSGNFKTVQAAMESIPRDNRRRIVVFVKDGVYREKIRIDAARVTLRGQSRENTRIEYPQLNDDFTRNPDPLGRAVLNVNGDDFVLENLTVANTAGIVGPHSFTIYGKGDRSVLLDCDLLSEGADTVSLWLGDRGRYYHARCRFRGSVDFVCPRGWCYVADSTFFETKATAALWHDGSKNRDMKFVLRSCRLDGVEGWYLGRHHVDAQFYLLDCVFSPSMIDKPLARHVYADDPARNAELDKSNLWGERSYYHNCHREGGDYAWHKDNLASAPGAPTPEQITAAWTFAGAIGATGKWDPERFSGPTIRSVRRTDDRIEVVFSEEVTAKGAPRLALRSGGWATYASGSGTDTLVFIASAGQSGAVASVDLGNGAILASEAAATLRPADVTLP